MDWQRKSTSTTRSDVRLLSLVLQLETNMIILASTISILLYALSAFLLLRRLTSGIQANERSKALALIPGTLAVTLHLVVMYHLIIVPEGLNLSLFHVLSLTTWLIATLVMFSALRQPIENLGIVVLPLAALALGLQSSGLASAGQITTDTLGVKIHILLSIFSFSLLSIATMQAILLAIQTQQLRNRHPGGFVRALPPLETMEHLLFRMIGLGYILLSAALLTGATFIEDIFAQHLVHKTVLASIAWVVFAILLWGRWHYGWRGRIAVRWTLSGFVVLLLAYFGSKLVLELILQR